MPEPDDFKHSYYIRTFGCQMNLHDSEHIAGVLEAAGYSPAATPEEAGLVVFNTCSVRKSAEDRAWGNIGRLKSLAPGARTVAVCGCMAERLGAEITARSDRVDLVFGMTALDRLPELLQECRSRPVCEVGEVASARIDSLPEVRRRAAQAWVPVSHGCDNSCAYCVVPAVRGPQVSRPPGDIACEVARLADDGVLEVTLLGQNVNSYGLDLSGGHDFARLLEAVAGVPGVERVKFETSHPADLTEAMLEVMSGVKEVCEHLHLPLQSGSDDVLARMNRRYDRAYFMDLVAKARSMVSGLSVSTDIIVGFPSETEEDFLQTMDLAGAVSFDSAYIFLYSKREDTPAANMAGEVDDAVKRERFSRLQTLQDRKTAESLARLVGSTQQVLIEGAARRGGMPAGRTRGHKVVLVEGGAPAGPLVEVTVTRAGRHALRGVATGLRK